VDHSQIGPIIACATGENNTSAISIIRISGFEDINMFRDFLALQTSKILPRFAHHTKLLHPKTKHIIDDIIVTFYQGPKSYNGENTLEISCHGNPFLIKNIIQVFIDFTDVRRAEPGEFTLRALENKKLTLSQVEGLDLILNSQSSYGINAGLKSLCGELHEAYLELERLTLRLCSAVELGIDFIDDVGEESFEQEKVQAINNLGDFLEKLHIRATGEYSTLLSPNVVLFGPVNAGKSSLFNFCLKSNRSIVSDQAGTTRDYISEYINIEGNHYKLLDTAGLRVSSEQIESEGIQRSIDLLRNAFYKVLVINPCEKDFKYQLTSVQEYDACILSHYDNKNFDQIVKDHLSLFNSKPLFKANLAQNGPIEPVTTSGSIEPKILIGPIEPSLFSLSALYGDIHHKYMKLNMISPIILPRHRQLIDEIMCKFTEFQRLDKNETDIAIISNELNIFSSKIQELIGVITQNQVLKNIFDNFCIGK
jgi:tRNA modification GTPase